MIYIDSSGLKIRVICRSIRSPFRNHPEIFTATVVKLVDTRDLKSLDLGHAGSIPASRTTPQVNYTNPLALKGWGLHAIKLHTRGKFILFGYSCTIGEGSRIGIVFNEAYAIFRPRLPKRNLPGGINPKDLKIKRSKDP